MTKMAVQETGIQAAHDQGGADTVPKAAEGKKETAGAPKEVVAVDTRVQAVNGVAVVVPKQTETKKVVPLDKTLEWLSNPKANHGEAEIIPRALQQVPETVVTITADGTVGKGFIFDQDGRIATSCGLVHSASRVKVKTYSGDVFLGKIVGLDADRDLAIIQIPTKTPRHLPIAATDVEVGADIFILNSASTTGGLTRAMINAVRVIGGTMLIQIDQPISSSQCGSPLVTEQGTAIGIVSEKLRQDIANTGFGVHLQELESLSD